MKTLEHVKQTEAQLLLPTYDRANVLFERGEGVYLFDADRRRYLDFVSGLGVNALGHAHPAIVKVIAEQAAKLVHVSNLYYHPYQAELALKLTQLSGLDRAFFCNSGTEAWEGALKLSRAVAGRNKRRLVMMTGSFHGRTMGSLSTTFAPKYREPFEPMLPDVTFVEFNNVEALRAAFGDDVCAVGIETIQGEGGVRPVTPPFLRAARDLADQHGALLLLDEIQCGLGRTGGWFAYQRYSVKPDVVTIAKPLAAGLPFGAVLTTEEVAAAFHPGMHGTTFGGGPLACRVALEFLSIVEREGLLQSVTALGEYFATKLAGLRRDHDCIVEVRQAGLMVGLELNSADLAKAIVKAMLAQGILINRTNETVLRFLPPYLIGTEHVDDVVGALGTAITQCLPMVEASHA